MERDEFWALIEETRTAAGGDAHVQVELLVGRSCWRSWTRGQKPSLAVSRAGRVGD
jgi:hypothetical protein